MPALVPIFFTTELLSLALLLVLASLLRTGKPGVREWMAANVAVAVALPLLGLRDQIPDSVSIVVANLVMALSSVSFYAGCARFVGQAPRWPVHTLGIGVLAAALIGWRYLNDSLPMRVLVTSMFSSAYCVAIACVLWCHHRARQGPYIVRLMMLLALIFALGQAVRGVYFVTLPEPPHTVMFASGWNIALLSLSAALMPTLTMAVVIMLHEAMRAEAEAVADYDHLTGALSRKRLEALAQTMIVKAAGQGRPLSLLLIDLDHFKRINDTYGHAGGDDVLCGFVRMVHHQLGEQGAMGRLGGEEFAVLLPDADLTVAMAVAERLRIAASQQCISGAFGHCRYSISIGVAGWKKGESFERLSMRADTALYAAKGAGRNRVLADMPSAEPVAATA